MYLVFLRPRWLALHLGVAAMVVVMINLGFWQLRRLDEKRDLNAAVAERTTAPPVSLEELRLTEPDAEADEEIEWRRVEVTGEYIIGEAVTVVNRSQNGAAGVMSVVPLRLDDGPIVLVNRGFVPLDIEVPAAPAGSVTVDGLVRLGQSRSGVGVADSRDPATTEFQRYDLPLIGASIDERVRGDATLVPMYVQVVSESPDDGRDLPDPATLPTPEEGPHLSYAVQWFFFTCCALAGWATVMTRKIKDLRRGSAPATASS